MLSGNIKTTYIFLIRMLRFFFFGGWGGEGAVTIFRFIGTIGYKSFDKRGEYKCREMKHERMVTRKNTINRIKVQYTKTHQSDYECSHSFLELQNGKV